MNGHGFELVTPHDGTVGGMDREIAALRQTVEGQALLLTLQMETIGIMERSFETVRQEMLRRLRELGAELACRCEEAYTSRGRHEPNSLCHLDSDVQEMVGLLA